jgi:WD40 repeat protein
LAVPSASSLVAFSLTGAILAVGTFDGTIRLWDTTDPRHPHPLGLPLPGPADTFSLAFSPTGATLAVGGYAGTIQLWDTTDPRHPHPLGLPLAGPVGGVWSVAFSHDGRSLAAVGADGTTRLWDVTDLRHPDALGFPLTGPVYADGSPGPINAVAFSPGTATLAEGAIDGTVWLWNLNPRYAIRRICAATAGDLTRKRWDQYVSNLPFQPPCTR